jgi:tetratricopeptide (TPR) repeat protein
MAWVNLSFVYSGLDDPEQARRAVAQAEALSGGASPREKRRIALRAKQLEAMADPSDAVRHAAYKKALDDALALDIDDVGLWLLRGNAEEASAAGRGQRGGSASTAFYHAALRLAPDNADAHHFLTHSYETIGQIPLALKHGEAYARLAPSIPHAHHMWGHDLRRVGRIDEAIVAFRRTDEMEKAYYAAERIPAEMDWHHVHNLDLLATAYQHKGRMRQAEATMREATALPPTSDYVEFQQKLLSIFLLGRERWDDALDSTSRLIQGRWSGTRAVGHALAGHALLARSRMAEARAALLAAERELLAVPASAAGIAVSRGQVKPWVDTLRGELLLREGEVAEGRRILEEMARTLRALPGPDAWIQALFRLESMARVARQVGQWELAGFMAQQMLEHDAAYGGSHLALALVAERAGDREAAAGARAEAARFWRDADRDLPELAMVGGPSVRSER